MKEFKVETEHRMLGLQRMLKAKDWKTKRNFPRWKGVVSCRGNNMEKYLDT